MAFCSMVFVLCFITSSLSLIQAQLNLYITKSNVNSFLKMNFNFDLYMIRDDKPANILEDSRAFYEFMAPLSSSVEGIKMSWFSSPESSSYSLRFLSSDLELMPNPVASIPSHGVVPHSAISFYISIECTGKKAGLIDVSMMLNYTRIVNGAVKNPTLKTFLIKTRRRCKKTVKDQEKKEGDGDGVIKWSRGAIVGLSAGITLFLCLSVGLVLLLRHLLWKRRLKMEFEDDLDLEEKRQFGLKKVRSLPIHKPLSPSSPPVVYSAKRPKFGVVQPRNRSETNASDTSTVGLICKDVSDDEQVTDQETASQSVVGRQQILKSLTGSHENQITVNENLLASSVDKLWSEHLTGLLLNPGRLEAKELLATGTLWNVYRGLLKVRNNVTNTDDTKQVVIKTMKDGIAMGAVESIIGAIKYTKGLAHPNLLVPMGVVLQPASTPAVVMPYMKYKELDKFLRQEITSKIDQQVLSSHVLDIGLQIARAMEYLASKNCVHKDLASRHCMVGENHEVKVVYPGRPRHSCNEKESLLSMKWMAPESLKDGIYSEKSDMWSFGITLWELVTIGKLPYASIDSNCLYTYLLSGNRLPQPLHCPDELYAVMMSCWSISPDDRPLFGWLVNLLSRKISYWSKQNTEVAC